MGIVDPEWEEVYGVGIGGMVAAIQNYAQRRPVISRIPMYAVWGTLGFFVGSWFHRKTIEKRIATDVMIMDYINQHPEDFPRDQPKKKWANVMETWHPIR